MTLTLSYGIWFGTGDGSDMFEWDYVCLSEEQEAAVREAVEAGQDPCEICEGDISELDPIFEEARREIEADQTDALSDDPYMQECMGTTPYTVEELNELVHDEDENALAYFGLTDADEEEIENWDAANLTGPLPTVADLDPDFVIENPFDGGWDLIIKGYVDEEEFEEDDEDDEDEEDEDDDEYNEEDEDDGE